MSTPKTLTRLEIEHLPNRRRKTAREWSSSCPFCLGDGGVDRLIHFLDEDEFWCRQCGAWGKVADGKGDGVDWQRLALAEAARRAEAERNTAVALEQVANLAPTVARYHANLLDKALRALWKPWGLTDESIDKYRLGYAFSCPTCRQSDSLTIPVYQAGKLVSIRHRLLHAPADAGKYRPQFGGLPPVLYNLDILQIHPHYVVLVEGEIKAMVLTQFGFPAVGVPGASTFKTEWVSAFAGQQVVVCFDPGAEEQAGKVSELLGAATLTLDCKPDDWFVVHHRSAEEFTHLVDTARCPTIPTILSLPVAPEQAAFDTFAWLDQLAEQEKPAEADMWEWLEGEAEKDRRPPQPKGFTTEDDGTVREMRREERLSNCGHPYHTIDPKTRLYRRFTFRCGLRECPQCQAIRAEKERQLVSGNPILYRLCVDPGVEREVLEALDSSQYRRYPQEGEDTVILHTDPAAGGDPVKPEDLDFAKLTSQPEGKKISGRLGKKSAVGGEDKSKEPHKLIRVEQVGVVDPLNRAPGRQEDEIRLCMEYAILATVDLEPTIDTLGKCLAQQMRKFKEHLLVAGYLPKYSVYDFIPVRPSEIAWSKTNESIREIYTDSPLLTEEGRLAQLRMLTQAPATVEKCPVVQGKKLEYTTEIPF